MVGAGHAGCEAAHASARMGARTLLLTLNLDTIAKMSCNPAIGGTAKGHMVREIDALGGIMGKIADQTGIQFRMLNRSKGPAVWSPRAQSDKLAYQTAMRHALEQIPNLFTMQGTTESFLIEEEKIVGVATKEGITFKSKAVILSAGTFMQGKIHIGNCDYSGGRAGDPPAIGLSKCLKELGFTLGRLKTGTPPRIHRRSVDFSDMEEQPGEEDVQFSYEKIAHELPQQSCFITYTNKETQRIAEENLSRSAMYSGKIQSVGPRYCPSFEDKIVRFADKERHQIFLEPEGLTTEEMYVNGISTSLPFDVQVAMLRSIPAFAHVEITRPAYAIEYDYVKSGQLLPTLETKLVKGLYFAGQINGTTGYEEAAGQGLVAAINAVQKIRGEEPFHLKRSESYIGVMIDELITKDLTEPYRMFTSRAEHRLLLRQENADRRLTPYGYKFGLISEERYRNFSEKKQTIESEIKRLEKVFVPYQGKSTAVAQILRRPNVSLKELASLFPEKVKSFSEEIDLQIEIELKFAGYIAREKKDVMHVKGVEEKAIPEKVDYTKIRGLRKEAMERLLQTRPATLGQAQRLSGVTHADIAVLRVHMHANQSN
ncbi:MAG: tRNA uridine-5-carboxymethylaminomethyl(34) synthesis enzyme MnmG [Chlamydiales bacterium]